MNVVKSRITLFLLDWFLLLLWPLCLSLCLLLVLLLALLLLIAQMTCNFLSADLFQF